MTSGKSLESVRILGGGEVSITFPQILVRRILWNPIRRRMERRRGGGRRKRDGGGEKGRRLRINEENEEMKINSCWLGSCRKVTDEKEGFEGEGNG